MGNPFIPFPRCENIIIVGDAAAEYLGALRIYGRGLIGGDVPSMELLHPMEKHLECVSCFLNDPTQVLMPAVRRMKANFVVLEENGSADFNPAAGREALEKEGYAVNVRMEGMGQIPEIQEIFIDHIRFSLKHRILDIMDKKAAYAAGKDE